LENSTDEHISTTIRKEFGDTTLLVIAHRLRTVITFDKVCSLAELQALMRYKLGYILIMMHHGQILVLDQGRVVEFGLFIGISGSWKLFRD
jgi:ABC-type multidrug transport system fused ATPase/permease subunit